MSATSFLVIEEGEESGLAAKIAAFATLQRMWTAQETAGVWRHVLQFAHPVLECWLTVYIRDTHGLTIVQCVPLDDRTPELFAYAYKMVLTRDAAATGGGGAALLSPPRVAAAMRAAAEECTLLCDMYDEERRAHLRTREYLASVINHVGSVLGAARSTYSMALALDYFAVQNGAAVLPCLSQTDALVDGSVPASRVLNFRDTCAVLARLDAAAHGALLERLTSASGGTLAWYLRDILDTIPD